MGWRARDATVPLMHHQMVRDLVAVEVLVVLGREKTIARTSKVLGIPRTTVNRRIAQLEQHLGLPLVERHGAGVRLTPAGHTVAARGSEVLDSARSLEMAAHEAAGRARQVRVAVPSGLGWGVFEALLRPHASLLSGLTIDMSYVSRSVHPIADGFDLVLSFVPAEDPNLICRPFVVVSWRCIGAAAYFQSAGVPSRLEHLGRHRLAAVVQPGAPPPGSWPLRGGGAQPVSPWFVSDSIDAVGQVVTSGQALALLPSLLELAPSLSQVLWSGDEHDVGVDSMLYLVTHRRLGSSSSGKQVATLLDAVVRALTSRQGTPKKGPR